jgi:NSS family neurotransmitter:Na+ symporter
MFIMAAIGSAIGLGNVWRFPYICYENGGGAFLLPFFIALFTAGIPLMILEFTVGHFSQHAAPNALKKINPRFEWIGWWMTFIPFIIAIYYVVVMAWCFSYMIYAIDLRWGAQADSFFLNSFLHITDGPAIFGSISFPVVLGLIAIWTSVFVILYKGVHRIGKVVLLTVPIPIILMLILTIRGLTLPGSIEGISYYLTPDFSKIFDVNVWLSAYAQVFFSLGVAQGIMITYASYLRKKEDINNNAFITALADAGTSFFAGFTVFSVVGYLAASQGVGIDQLGIAGPFLIFITYPTAISLLPVAAAIFGVLFYIALLTFGIDSAFSMIEPVAAGIHEKWRISKTMTTAFICIIGFLLSLSFTPGSGLYWLELIDHFIANFGLVVIGLIECIILGWMYPLNSLRTYANERSEIHIGSWWNMLIKYVIPFFLILLLIISIVENVLHPFMDFPISLIIIGGVLPLIIAPILGYLFMKKRGEISK